MVAGSDRVPVEDVELFVTKVLVAQGVLEEHARITASRMADADVRGRTGHGLIRLPQYSERIRAGGYNLRPVISVRNETSVSALVDGDNGFGQVVMTRAAEIAISKATEHGIGWVGTVHSNHAGAAGIYPAMALSHGLAAMYFAVANGNGMPPWGGREKLLGTNPIAVAFPAGDRPPFQLDMATTVVSHGTIAVTAQSGEEMPVGWVIDRDGEPITDPSLVDDGFLMPIGGYKGAGLNIMIGLLAGVMTGAAFGRDVVSFRDDHETPTNTGQSILVFRPDLFIDRDDYLARIDSVLADLHGSESMTDEPVRLPGDQAIQRESDSRRLGIPVPVALRSQLDILADRVGVAHLT